MKSAWSLRSKNIKVAIDCVKIALGALEVLVATVFSVAENSVPKLFVKRGPQVSNGLCPYCQNGEVVGPSVKKTDNFF